MTEVNGYFRVNPVTVNGPYELAIYKKGFAQADFKDRLIIGTYATEGQAYRAIETVLVTVSKE